VNRIRMEAPLDGDSVSPDAIRAANTFLTTLIEERAEGLGIAPDWNTFKSRVRTKRNGDVIVIQWVRVIHS